jgi:molybdopterin-containing oxidoreductase family membrane subunit
MCKILLATGMMVGYAYGIEFFIAWYSRNIVEMETFQWRATGDYAFGFWIMVTCNVMVPVLFFFKRIRTSIPWLFGISIVVNIGMWFERFVIIIGSVAHDFLPHAWGLYAPTWVEFGIMVGSFSLFFFLFMLFCKHLPSVSMTEMKETLAPGGGHGH